MSESRFYEQYWSFQNSGAAMEAPPEWTPRQLASHLRTFGPFLGATCLDLGCGEGVFTEALSSVTKAVGLELSRTAIDRGLRRNPALDLRQGNIEALPFEDASFDSITMVEVIEHLVDVEAALRECARVLKPGGHLVMTTTDFNWLKKVLIAALCWERYFYPTNPHIRFFTRKTLRRLAERFGFEEVLHKWNGSYYGLMPHGQIMVCRKLG